MLLLEAWRVKQAQHTASLSSWLVFAASSFISSACCTGSSAVNLWPEASVFLIPCRYTCFVEAVLIFAVLHAANSHKNWKQNYIHKISKKKSTKQPTPLILGALLSIGKWHLPPIKYQTRHEVRKMNSSGTNLLCAVGCGIELGSMLSLQIPWIVCKLLLCLCLETDNVFSK